MIYGISITLLSGKTGYVCATERRRKLSNKENIGRGFTRPM